MGFGALKKKIFEMIAIAELLTIASQKRTQLIPLF
jgi:hypothetical protein